MSIKSSIMLGAMLLTSCGFVGCSKSTDNPAPNAQASSSTSAHGEWWCNEHGVPEAVCAQCDVKLVADFKAKGDWCAEHARPDSQCFICHPDKQAEFAAQYEAKYGKQPPKPELGGEKHDHDHDHDHDAEKAAS